MTTKIVTNAASRDNPDYSISTNTGTVDDGTQRVTLATDVTVPTSVSGLVSASSGTADAAGTEVGVYVRPVTPSADVARIGSITETAPATDTASSGLNGRLQRIAQRITSLIALIPAALTGSGNFKVSLQESNASQGITTPATSTTGTITASAQTVAQSLATTAYAQYSIALGGTFTLTSQLEIEGSCDNGTNWFAIFAYDATNLSSGQITSVVGSGTVRYLLGACAGLTNLRVRCSTFQAGNSISVRINFVPIADSALFANFVNLIASNQTSGVGNSVIWDGAANFLSIDSSGRITISQLAAAQALSDTKANPTTTMVGAAGMIYNGSTWSRWLQAANALNSTGTGLPNVVGVAQFDDASPTTITENRFGHLRMSTNRNLYGTIRDAAGNERGLNISANNAASVAGDIASGASDSGNPVKIGGIAKSANPTAVTDAQRVNALFDLLGRQVTSPWQIRENWASSTPTAHTASTTAISILAADASNKNDIMGVLLENNSATATEYIIYDDDGTTERARFYLPAADTRGITLPGPLKQTAVNKAWKAKTVTSVSSVYVTLFYVKNG